MNEAKQFGFTVFSRIKAMVIATDFLEAEQTVQVQKYDEDVFSVMVTGDILIVQEILGRHFDRIDVEYILGIK